MTASNKHQHTPAVEQVVAGWKNLGANYDDGRQIKLIDTDRSSTAFVMVGGRNHHANADLIAAAPELLKASQEFTAYLDAWTEVDLPDGCRILDNARAAIDKAKGGAA